MMNNNNIDKTFEKIAATQATLKTIADMLNDKTVTRDRKTLVEVYKGLIMFGMSKGCDIDIVKTLMDNSGLLEFMTDEDISDFRNVISETVKKMEDIPKEIAQNIGKARLMEAMLTGTPVLNIDLT